MRATDILWDRVWQLERENFAREEGFAFLPMTTAVDLADDPTAQHPVVQAEVQSIRTDLDRFSDEEINALVRHGYEVARNECRRNHLLDDRIIPDTAPWAPIATSAAQDVAEPTRLGGAAPATQLAQLLAPTQAGGFKHCENILRRGHLAKN
jgi:hypothetical protein